MGGAVAKLKGPKKDKKKSASKEGQQRLLQECRCMMRFEEPAPAIGAAGGTAGFFQLLPPEEEPLYADDREDAPYEWLGKDLGHAFDELEFYKLAEEYKGEVGWRVLNSLIGYGGALGEYPVMCGDIPKIYDIIVMESLVVGLNAPRLLDLKIGARTSSGNWKGKSEFASMRQNVLDAWTNSTIEGLRLEGFMNPPVWMDSLDPLAWMGGCKKRMASKKVQKKAKRLQLQNTRLAEVMKALIDLRSETEQGLHQKNRGGIVIQESGRFTSSEYAEMVLLSTITQLAHIYRACAEIPVPQKWIGSSVAIVCDANFKPARPSAKGFNGEWPHEAAVPHGTPPMVNVKIFDWGRSEFNTQEFHQSLPDGHQQDRSEFWSLYKIGVGRILWEACRTYYSRFCVIEWALLKVEVWVYNSFAGDTLVGTATMPLREEKMHNVNITLKDEHGDRVVGKNGDKSQVTVSVDYKAYPEPSRLGNYWAITCQGANNLPPTDYFFLTRPPCTYAVVSVVESADSAAECGIIGGGRVADMRTSVINTTKDPVWGDRFEFPVVADPDTVEQSLHGNFAGLQAMSEAMTEEGEKKTDEDGDFTNENDLVPGDTWVNDDLIAGGMPAAEAQFLDVFLRKLGEGDDDDDDIGGP